MLRCSRTVTFVAAAGALWIGAPAYSQQTSAGDKPAADPNQRICEDIVQTGSRLATKRFCGTRAEWEARQKQDRDTVENAQRMATDPCHSTMTHTGAPNCG
jgi:hypothetical protein